MTTTDVLVRINILSRVLSVTASAGLVDAGRNNCTGVFFIRRVKFNESA